jgi:metal-responsive CopG/Arc/MetJ family transcriptional regulator
MRREMRINTIVDDDLLNKLDQAAKEMKISRSFLIRAASERYLREYEVKKAEEERKRKFEAAARLQDGLRDKGGEWDGVGEIRKARDEGR